MKLHYFSHKFTCIRVPGEVGNFCYIVKHSW